jgi:hypothetical protein
MSVIRVIFADNFGGEDVVLAAMDGPGVIAFYTALRDAEQVGSSQVSSREVTHDIVIQDGAADINIGEHHVTWRLDPAVAAEISADLSELSASDSPGHHYVDISRPTQTLVLSRDEYVGAVRHDGVVREFLD